MRNATSEIDGLGGAQGPFLSHLRTELAGELEAEQPRQLVKEHRHGGRTSDAKLRPQLVEGAVRRCSSSICHWLRLSDVLVVASFPARPVSMNYAEGRENAKGWRSDLCCVLGVWPARAGPEGRAPRPNIRRTTRSSTNRGLRRPGVDADEDEDAGEAQTALPLRRSSFGRSGRSAAQVQRTQI